MELVHRRTSGEKSSTLQQIGRIKEISGAWVGRNTKNAVQTKEEKFQASKRAWPYLFIACGFVGKTCRRLELDLDTVVDIVEELGIAHFGGGLAGWWSVLRIGDQFASGTKVDSRPRLSSFMDEWILLGKCETHSLERKRFGGGETSQLLLVIGDSSAIHHHL